MEKNRIIFIEPEISGHHLIHIELLCDYIFKKKLTDEFIFLVHPKFWTIIEERNKKDSIEIYKKNGICFSQITQDEYKYYTHSNELIAALYKSFLIKKYIKKFKPNQICLLMGDHLQYLLDPIFIFKKVKISGIIFRPSVHYPSVFGNQISIKEKITNLRKTFLYQKMLINPVINLLFSHDNYFVEYAHKKYINGDKIKYLPDITMYSENYAEKRLIWNSFALPKDRTFFFMFGHLSERKGILVLLKALLALPPEFQKNTAVFIAGKIDLKIKDKVFSLYKKICDNTTILIILKDKYISDQEINYYIDKCHAVLIPYQRFTGSSGILLWAIEAGKPVLTQKYGLIGKFVKEKNLGITVDTENEEKIRNGIITFLRSKSFDTTSLNNFVKNHKDHLFSEILIRSLINKT